MGRSPPGQRRPTSTTVVTLVTTTGTSTRTTSEVVEVGEDPNIWYQYLEQYLLPLAGTAVAVVAIKANDSVVNWLVGSLLFNFIKINPLFFFFRLTFIADNLF
jgi:hypothetical protein